jgi:hypothetical protein
MAAFHESFPAVTPLQNAADGVNLSETCAGLASPNVRKMPLLTPPSPPASVRGEKRRLLVFVIAIALAFCGVAAWSAMHRDSYGRQATGCISVTVPSSTGGALLHQCGANARATCWHAFRRHDRLSLLMRPSCRSAGLQ